MTLSFYNIIAIVILFQLILMVLFLLTVRKGKRISNRILAFFFLLLITNLTDGLLTFYGFYTHFPELAHLEDGFIFLYGPVIYFYTGSVIYKDLRLSWKELVHLIPFVSVTIVYQLFYHLQDQQYQLMVQKAIVDQALPRAFYLTAVVIYVHIGIYMTLSLLELKRYRKSIREKFSSLEKVNLDWLSYFLWSLNIIMFLSFVYTMMPAVGLKDYFQIVMGMVFLILFFFINGVVWKGLKQPEIFAGFELKETGDKKYKDQLTTHEKTAIEGALVLAMEQRQDFLNPDLTLEGLAEKLGYPARRISQVINDQFNQNFYDFINSYRIREAERIFRESNDPKLTVLEVMYSCGFNSKSSFNTIFKQKTGLTPSAYRQSIRNT